MQIVEVGFIKLLSDNGSMNYLIIRHPVKREMCPGLSDQRWKRACVSEKEGPCVSSVFSLESQLQPVYFFC
jgi:hypothetical protein